MTISHLVFSFESAFLLGQSLLLISLLALRDDPYGIYKPLMAFFAANSVNQLAALTEPIVALGASSSLYLVAETLSIPAFLLLAPLLWLYVRGLTSEAPAHSPRQDLVHFVPSLVAMLVALVLLLAPIDVQESIIGDGQEQSSRLVTMLTVALVLLMVLWSLQVLGYVVVILRRIFHYRAQLKDVFASTEGRELRWLVWFVVVLVLSTLVLIPDFLFGLPEGLHAIPLVLDMILFWFLAVWGLTQKPGFAPEQGTRRNEVPVAHADRKQETAKYTKSALTDADMQRIASKIKNSMSDDALYLEPDLSLSVLSKHIAVQPNYVSQTLNAHMHSTFFDYVNHWRIEHAKPLLTAGSDNVTVITYEVGFNSRSSFYKAFKQETAMTPTAYRTQYGSK